MDSIRFVIHMFIVFIILISAESEGTSTIVDPGEEGVPTVMLVLLAVGAVMILTVVIIVVIGRKRARGITWFPEGFFSRGSDAGATARSSKRHGPDGGEEMK